MWLTTATVKRATGIMPGQLLFFCMVIFFNLQHAKILIMGCKMKDSVFQFILVGWLEFNVPFQHRYGYIRDKIYSGRCVHLLVPPYFFTGHPTQPTTSEHWRQLAGGGHSLFSPDGVAPSRMVGVSASVSLPLHHKVQKFSSGTGCAGWSRKKGRKTVVCSVVCVHLLISSMDHAFVSLNDDSHETCIFLYGYNAWYWHWRCATRAASSLPSGVQWWIKDEDEVCGWFLRVGVGAVSSFNAFDTVDWKGILPVETCAPYL